MTDDTKQTKPTIFYTAEEVAEMLRVHWQTVLDYIRTGQLEAVKIGKSYRVSAEALNKFLLARTVGRISEVDINMAKVNERISELLGSSGFKSKRVVVLSASFSPVPELEELFNTSAQPNFVDLLQNPPITREMGWILRNYREQPKPALGKYLEVVGGNSEDPSFAVRLFKDGNLLTGASAGFEYLGWAVNYDDQQRPTDGNNINGMAVADYIFNFALLTCAIAERLEKLPDFITLHLHISNPTNSKIVNILRDRIGFRDSYGEPLQDREAVIQSEYKLKGKPIPEELAASLWKEYGHVFGLLDDHIPFLDADKKRFDRNVFKT